MVTRVVTSELASSAIKTNAAAGNSTHGNQPANDYIEVLSDSASSPTGALQEQERKGTSRRSSMAQNAASNHGFSGGGRKMDDAGRPEKKSGKKPGGRKKGKARARAASDRDIRLPSKSTTHFPELMHGSPMGVHCYFLEPDGRLIFSGANPAADRILGVDHRIFIGKTIEEAFPPLAETEIPMRYISAARDGIAWSTEHVTYEHGKIKGVFQVHAIQTLPMHVMAMFLDITYLKKKDTALRESEERYRLLFQNAGDITFYHEISPTGPGRFLDVNELACRTLGYTRDEMLSMSVGDIDVPEQQQRIPAILDTLFSTGRVMFITEIVTKGGRRIPVETHVALFEFRGKPTILSIVRDITERMEAEKIIRQKTEELEERVSERTSQLEHAIRELESFAYSVSHDLRAPLRSIDGFSKILQEECAGQIGSDGCEYLKRIRNASQRMSELIDGLLGLSRITRDEMTVEEVDLSAMASDIAREIQGADPLWKGHWIIEPGLHGICDRRLMRAALDNLLGNAWKFTSHTAEPRIEFGVQEREGQRAFFIRDNGAGFNMEYARRLFGAFQRLHGVHEFPGTGIGLATVQRIISRHGGRVWAEGAVGEGATFWFILPM
jgi:PAS domain S-box-containing protein